MTGEICGAAFKFFFSRFFVRFFVGAFAILCDG